MARMTAAPVVRAGLILLVCAIVAAVLWFIHTPVSDAIEDEFEKSGKRSVDLAQAVPQAWHRVCVLAPYTTPEAASEVLGFPWNPATVSPIGHSDGIALLVFVTHDRQVAAFSNQWRRVADFTPSASRCYLRSQARFVRLEGKRGLSPAH